MAANLPVNTGCHAPQHRAPPLVQSGVLRGAPVRVQLASLPRLRVVAPCRAAVSTEKPPSPRKEEANTSSTRSAKFGEGRMPDGVSEAALPTYGGSGGAGTARARVVVLGSGWGAISFIKALKKADSARYDVTLISPRNYFLYTPLLPAVATGTVEERSIVEPVRRALDGKGKYFEAVCHSINTREKTLVACFPKDAGLDEACFKVPYDILVLGTGCINNTFGISGVEEHTFFFKSIRDAARLRRQVSECFERASLPQTPPEERAKLLSFVVVGGGPTGVEVAAELHDMVTEDLAKVYGELVKDVRIRVIELQDHILSTYDRQISKYAGELFRREGIELVLNTKVRAVNRGSVSVVDGVGNAAEIPFGACVWATGVAMHPLVKQLQQELPAGTQTHFRSILTDEHLCVKGSQGSIYAVGDAATIEQPKALDRVEDLFSQADKNADGELTLEELRNILRSASAEYSHLAEFANFLDGKVGVKRWGNMVWSTLASAASRNKQKNGRPASDANPSDPTAELSEEASVSREQFGELLGKIDRGLRALPATAQVAKQQGEYMAHLLHKHELRPGQALPPGVPPFKYNHKGSLAYVGGDKAVMDVPKLGPITGYGAGLLWKGFETYSQISFRNKCLVALDWARTKVFGRDISRV